MIKYFILYEVYSGKQQDWSDQCPQAFRLGFCNDIVNSGDYKKSGIFRLTWHLYFVSFFACSAIALTRDFVYCVLALHSGSVNRAESLKIVIIGDTSTIDLFCL